MAGSFTPTPGATLAAVSTPLVYEATTEIVAISIGFGTKRIEERAFRDGVFLPGYTRSTRVDNVFTLVRDSAWPADPKLFVDPVPAPPPGGQAWGGIYTLDFAAQPNQDLNASGAHTIDGRTWWAKNSQGTSSVSIVNGEGLDWYSGSDGIPAARVLCLPLANVPGFNALAPFQVWFNVQRISGADGTLCGLIDSPADATPHTADRPSSAFWFTPSYNGGVLTSYFISRAAGNTGFSGPDHGADWTLGMFGVYVVNAWTDAALLETGYADGALPPLNAFEYSSLAWVTGRPAKRVSPCIALTSLFNASTRIRKISVIQPKVAA